MAERAPTASHIRISHDRFMDSFFPIPAQTSQLFRKTPEVQLSAFENKIRTIIPDSKDQMKNLTPLLMKHVNTHKVAQGFYLSPDPSLYLESLDGWAELSRVDDAKPNWAKPRVLFRFVDHDPYQELEPCLLPRGSHVPADYHDSHKVYREEVRQDIARTVQHHFVVQHVTAVFVVIIHRFQLRLSRWDRDGTIFSKIVNYTNPTGALSDVLWRISMLTDEQLGSDPTVTPVLPGSPDYQLMEDMRKARPEDHPCENGAKIEGNWRNTSREFAYVRERFSKSLEDTEARWKLAIPLEDGSNHSFLAATPFSHQSGLQVDGRNGRAYIAIDCKSKRFVFLKDVWRYACDDDVRLREGEVLSKLNNAKERVYFVPTLVCERDLPGQQTKTRDFYKRPPYVEHEFGDINAYNAVWPRDAMGNAIVRKAHYRFAVREVCISLYDGIKSGKLLLSVFRDCLKAHSTAVRAGFIHGDISCGNLMIYPKIDPFVKGGPAIRLDGMLIDWEMNRPAEPGEDYKLTTLGVAARTWAYVPYAVHCNPTKNLTVGDELESLMWLQLVLAVRLLRTELTIHEVRGFVADFVIASYKDDERTKACKEHLLQQGIIATHFPIVFKGRKDDRLKSIVDSPLNVFFAEYLHLCHAVFWSQYDRELPVRPLGQYALERDKVNEPQGDAGPEMVDARELAKKLDYDTVLKIMDKVLAMQWPQEGSDYVGDQFDIAYVAHYKKEAEAAKKANLELAALRRTVKNLPPQASDPQEKDTDKDEDEQKDEATPPPPKRPARKAGAQKNQPMDEPVKEPTRRAGPRKKQNAEPEPTDQPSDRRNPGRRCREPPQPEASQGPPTKRRRRC